MLDKFILLIGLILSISFFSFIKSEELATEDDLENFKKWFEDHGGRCRCRFAMTKDKKLSALADRRIVEKESILMAPQSLLVNSTVIERY